MKKTIFIFAAALAAFAACDPMDPEDPSAPKENLDAEQPTITYAGETYKVINIGGKWWMAENLRFLPEGKTASATPGDEAGVWLPFSIVNAKAVADSSLIATNGYFYDFFTATGLETPYTIDSTEAGVLAQVAAVEGIQGICPTGWYIPTEADFVNICGESTVKFNYESDLLKNAEAPFWNGTSGSAKKAFDAGFDPFFGSIANNSYMATTVAAGKGPEEFIGKTSINTLMGSTMQCTKTVSKVVVPITAESELKFSVMQTTFTATYAAEGRLSVAAAVAPKAACPVRCVRK